LTWEVQKFDSFIGYMNLFKKIHINIDGWNEGLPENFTYFISEASSYPDEEPIDNNEVVEADCVYLTYHKYVNLGEISINEIETLKKFEIL
jgi:hypothetical protein